MISLEKYLKLNKEEERFGLPLSFVGKIKFELMKTFLLTLPFKNKIYIDSPYGYTIYFELVIAFVKNKFGLKQGKRYSSFGIGSFGYKSNMISEVKNGVNDFLVHGHGASFLSQQEADSKALGEYLERYASSFPTAEDLAKVKKTTWKKFLSEVKNLRDYHGFCKEQLEKFKNYNLEENREVKVLPVIDLITKKETEYLFQQIFWNQDHIQKEEGNFASCTTSGCAGGFTEEMAILGAIYELVERDAFLCYWLTKTAPVKIIFEKGVSKIYDEVSKFLELSNYELKVFDITTELKIPSILCVIRGKINNEIMVAASSKMNFLDAVESALEEVMSCGIMSNQEKKFELDVNIPVYLNTKIGRDERVNFWVYRNQVGELDFLFESQKKISINNENISKFSSHKISQKQELENLLKIFKDSGEKFQNLYLYKFQNSNLSQIGFQVVRVIVPYLYPIYLFEHAKLPNSSRLRDFNLFKNGSENFVINPEIHPFP